MIQSFKIGNRQIGNGNPSFVVAELSGNHNGSIKNALDMVYSAKEAGADAIKLQTYTPDTITLKTSKKDFLIGEGSPWSKYKNLWNLYNKAHTPWQWHKEIFTTAKKLGLEVFSSPFDESAVDFLVDLNVSAFKIASPEINHIPLIEKVARTKKPVIISSGLASVRDINLAIKTLRSNGCSNLILLKCTSAYPTPANEANLSTISDIPKKFKVFSGLSDHTSGIISPVIAVSFGAVLIEKHFKGKYKNPSVDSFFSLNEKEFSEMVNGIRFAEQAIGKKFYGVSDSAKVSLSGRRSIYTSKKIKKGERISEDNIKVVRPGFGMSPKNYKNLLGSIAKSDIDFGEKMTWSKVIKKDK